jgi:serine/threonine-protein kinase RsbW
MKVPPDFGVDEADLVEASFASDLRSARATEQAILRELVRRRYGPDMVFGIKLALEEALTNAVKHGNRNDARKQVVVRYHVGRDRTVIMVRDEGAGFTPESLPDPTTEENLERPFGRGIMLMQSYMTRVQFVPPGNEVWMLKERRNRKP